MDQITDELKKMVKAGMGAVAAGVEKTQEAIDLFAKKGEPIYQQAKSAVADAAGKMKQAVNESLQAMNAKPKAEELIRSLKEVTQEEWACIRDAVDTFHTQAQEAVQEARDAADDLLRPDGDGAADAETPADPQDEENDQPEE